MSEWLRRQTRNLLGYACAGSNPAVDVLFFHFFSRIIKKINLAKLFLEGIFCFFRLKKYLELTEKLN